MLICLQQCPVFFTNLLNTIPCNYNSHSPGNQVLAASKMRILHLTQPTFYLIFYLYFYYCFIAVIILMLFSLLYYYWLTFNCCAFQSLALFVTWANNRQRGQLIKLLWFALLSTINHSICLALMINIIKMSQFFWVKVEMENFLWKQ